MFYENPHYLYNAFIIEENNLKVAIDLGALLFHYFRLTSLIPKSAWEGITHLLIPHETQIIIGMRIELQMPLALRLPVIEQWKRRLMGAT